MFSVMADLVVETISFRSRDHEFLKPYHGDICDILIRSEETLIMFAGMLYGKRIIDVHTKNAVIRRKGSEGAEILMDRVEMKVEQTPRHLKRILRVMKKLEDLETIGRKIGSKISRSRRRRRSHPLLSSDMSSVEESSSVSSPGEAVKPTVSELCSELKGLVEWENTIIHLPAMNNAEVKKVKRDEPKIDQQKQEAFDTWLRRCPGASWSHVRDALRKAGEHTLEKKIATNHGLSLVFSEDPSRRTQDDTAITCPRTAVQTGSMTVAASRDPHGGSTHCHMYSFTETVEAAKTLSKAFNNLVESALPMISELDADRLKLRINMYIRDEQQNTCEVQRDLDYLHLAKTAHDVLCFLINRNFLGYLNYELLEVFEDMVSSDKLTFKIQKYKTDHDRFLQCTDFKTLIEVFKEKPELRPASAVGLPKFTLHLESQWEGRSTYSWKELLDKQFNWPPHVHVTSITRNCIVIEYSVLPFFASAVVRDLTDPLVLAVLKRQGVTVKLSQELIEMGIEMIGPRNDQLHCAVVTGTVADVEKLIEGGASVQEKDEEGYTPLHLAAMCGRTDIVKALNKHGADVQMKTQDKYIHVYKEKEYTSLHLAAQSGITGTVETLIKHGANVHEKTTERGCTSLHLAAKSGKTDTVEALIKHGADVHDKTTREAKYQIHYTTFRGMATPLGDGGQPNKRFNAKYNCKWCKETWKTKNTSHLKMICKNRDCRRIVRAYKFEVINKLVVYKCESCDSLLKKTKCSSEVKDVPYCRICEKDMVVYHVKDLWRKKRMFGEFFCDDCHHGWKSGSAWDGVGQKCRHCNLMILPHLLSPFLLNLSHSQGQSHREDLCDMCKQLGRNCKSYVPPDEDIAMVYEIPLEEDTQSVITTNSSVVGEEDDDYESGSNSGGDRTTIFSDDYLIDPAEDIDEMMSKMKINEN